MTLRMTWLKVLSVAPLLMTDTEELVEKLKQLFYILGHFRTLIFDNLDNDAVKTGAKGKLRFMLA